MTQTAAFDVLGIPASPYTRKLLSLLRYRRIPHRFVHGVARFVTDRPRSKVALLPTAYLPNADGGIEAVVDTTPIIRRLEAEHAGRAARPADPVLALLDALLEDYGDEWLTKAMFHYRWSYQADIDLSASILPRMQQPRAAENTLQDRGREFAERQISRLYVVGSNPQTGPLIEESYRRFLALFSRHLEDSAYLLGNRPAASDFALFGQLTQLAQFDPTPMALTLAEAPRVYAWTSMMEDLSGREVDESDWISRNDVPASLKALLSEIGRVYVPVMLANARALRDGAESVTAEIDGQTWTQQPFPYQGKCVQWLRQDYAALSEADRQAVDGLLSGTGCEALFAGAA